MRGPENYEAQAARMRELMLAYETAIAVRDRCTIEMVNATNALNAADEELIEVEAQLARHMDEMKASSRLRVRLKQGPKGPQ